MSRSIIDVTGRTFSRLTVIRHNGFSRSGEATWLCACSCGAEVTATGGNLRSGNTSSCGCFKLEEQRARSTTHGHTKCRQQSPEYRTWIGMNARCRNPNHEKFKYYGGIGRAVHEEWHKPAAFIAYVLEHLGPKPSGMTLERIDNEQGYVPGNIRWATWKEQAANRRKRRKISAVNEPGLPIFLNPPG